MKGDSVPRLNLSGLRKAGTVSTNNLVRTELLHPGVNVPLVLFPNVEDLSLVSWAAAQRDFLQQLLCVTAACCFATSALLDQPSFRSLSRLSPGGRWSTKSRPRHVTRCMATSTRQLNIRRSTPLFA